MSYAAQAAFGAFLGGCIWGLIPLIIGICKQRYTTVITGIVSMVFCGICGILWITGSELHPMVIAIIAGLVILFLPGKQKEAKSSLSVSVEDDPNSWVCYKCKNRNVSRVISCQNCGLNRDWTNAKLQEKGIDPQKFHALPTPAPTKGHTQAAPDTEIITPCRESVPQPQPAPAAAMPDPEVTVPSREPDSRSAVILVLENGPMAGTQFRCRQDSPIFIGRNPARSNLSLHDYNAVSGLHCRVDVRGGGITVTDLGSTNGTFVNSVRLSANQSAEVADGGAFLLGSRDCRFRVQSEQP